MFLGFIVIIVAITPKSSKQLDNGMSSFDQSTVLKNDDVAYERLLTCIGLHGGGARAVITLR